MRGRYERPDHRPGCTSDQPGDNCPERREVELVWPGKREPRLAGPLPLSVLERYGCGATDRPNQLIRGDNMEVMCSLPELVGGVDLIYIDPPFGRGTSRTYRREVQPAEQPSLTIEGIAYDDWSEKDRGSYLQMLYDRLTIMRQLLSPAGSLYLHLDSAVVHEARLVMDEVFGRDCFQRQLIWRIGWVSGFKSRARNWIRNHDTILYYARDPARVTFNKQYIPYPPGYVRRDGVPPVGPGHPIDDVWNASPAEFALTGEQSLDSIQIKSFSREKTGYPTQKNISLVERIIRASSNPGDLVADFFCGSGTTAVAAERLGRSWISCDISALAVQTARKRLLAMGETRPFEVLNCGAAESASADPGPAVTARIDVQGRVASVSIMCESGAELIDGWIVDFTHRPGEPVLADWWTAGQGQETPLRSGPHCYTSPGTYHVLVRVLTVTGSHSDQTLVICIE